MFVMPKKILTATALIILIILLFSALTIDAAAAPYKNFKIGAGKNIIEAEDFDTEDFYDTGNDGSYAYRPDGAQTENCGNYTRDDAPEDNYNIGWTADGEWVQYTVNVEKAGVYKFDAWLASEPASGGIEIFYDNKSVGSAYAEESFGWQDWGLYPAGQIEMSEGKHIIKVGLTVSVNLDAVVITLLENGAAAAVNPPAQGTVGQTTENSDSQPEKKENNDSDYVFSGYAAAQDLSDYDTVYTLAVIAVIGAFIAIIGAGTAVIIAIKTAGKIRQKKL